MRPAGNKYKLYFTKARWLLLTFSKMKRKFCKTKLTPTTGSQLFLVRDSYSVTILDVVNLVLLKLVWLIAIFFLSEILENTVEVFSLMRKEMYGWLIVNEKETRKTIL